MKKVLFASLLAFGLVGCASPVAQCKESVKVSCQRIFECFDSATKSSAGFIAGFGATETECNTKQGSAACGSVTDEKPCSDSSKKYYPDKAAACITDFKAASCETIKGGTFTSANCDNSCS
jgi:hypothetical protein